MNRFPEICRMFVVYEIFINHEAPTTKKVQTNQLGRHTGESPPVLSMLRMEVSYSDLPYLFHFKPIKIMYETMDKCATCTKQQPITAEQIVREIIDHDAPEAIRETLREMMDTFFLYYSSETAEVITDAVFCTYKALDHALKQIAEYERVNLRRKEPC